MTLVGTGRAVGRETGQNRPWVRKSVPQNVCMWRPINDQICQIFFT